MEYVFVDFPRVRDVFVRGLRIGQTKTVLRINRGHHTFDLGVPVTYRPPSQTVTIANTSEMRPKVVRFEQA